MFQRLTWLKRLQIALAFALITFAVLLGAFTLRTALGKDPALGASGSAHGGTVISKSSSADEEDDDESSFWEGLISGDDGAASQPAPMTTSQS